MRLFTLEEANELLPRVEAMLRDLMRQREALAEKQQALAEAQQRTSSNGHSVAEKLAEQTRELEELAAALNSGIAELQELGCTVKDLDIGLLDFPSLRDGEVVNLCWRLGEPRVAFWHTLDTGFASRQPL